MNAGELVITFLAVLNAWALVRGWQYLFGWLPAPESLTIVNGKLTPLYRDIDGVRYVARWTPEGVVSWERAEDQPIPVETKKIKLVQGKEERTI